MEKNLLEVYEFSGRDYVTDDAHIQKLLDFIGIFGESCYMDATDKKIVEIALQRQGGTVTSALIDECYRIARNLTSVV